MIRDDETITWEPRIVKVLVPPNGCMYEVRSVGSKQDGTVVGMTNATVGGETLDETRSELTKLAYMAAGQPPVDALQLDPRPTSLVDEKTGALYVYLRHTSPDEPVYSHAISDLLSIDYDSNGDPVGVEWAGDVRGGFYIDTKGSLTGN